jgi:hypothetical protein
MADGTLPNMTVREQEFLEAVLEQYLLIDSSDSRSMIKLIRQALASKHITKHTSPPSAPPPHDGEADH